MIYLVIQSLEDGDRKKKITTQKPVRILSLQFNSYVTMVRLPKHSEPVASFSNRDAKSLSHTVVVKSEIINQKLLV